MKKGVDDDDVVVVVVVFFCGFQVVILEGYSFFHNSSDKMSWTLEAPARPKEAEPAATAISMSVRKKQQAQQKNKEQHVHTAR